MKNIWKILLSGLLIGLLVLIRHYEYKLFYDPFMAFFSGGVAVEGGFESRWYLNVFLRYCLNSMISLAVIYVVFRRLSVVKFAGLLYVGLFLVLFPLFVYLMGTVTLDDYLAVFYIRRFLVHPVLLLVLLPAIYYQQLKVKKTGSCEVPEE